MTTQRNLVHAAQGGDPVSLGLLLEQFRPALYARALSFFGRPAEAEDAVSETLLKALTKIHQLREPDAVGGWLFTLLRHTCLMQIRERQREIPLPEHELPEPESSGLEDIEKNLDQMALRNWIWNSLESLSEPLRLVVMLRYFGSYNSYEQMAWILCVPVGTVKSRLAQARASLSAALMDNTATLFSDSMRLSGHRHDYFKSKWERFYTGDRDNFFRDFSRDLLLTLDGKRFAENGYAQWQRELCEDLEVGSVFSVQRVFASGPITVIEGDYQNSAEYPNHCPPKVAAVFIHPDRGMRVNRIHGYYAPRSPGNLQ